jgi:hypothetical protein
MLTPLQDFFTLVVVAVLVAISFATLVQSRRVERTFVSYADYLFQPRHRVQSIASNVGAVFSLTGFFGATFIYAVVLGGPIQIVVGVVFLTLAIAMTAIVRRIDADADVAAGGNILLDYLHAKLPRKDFGAIITIYTFIYFALLFEELAVSRLVLFDLLAEPVIVGALLALIVFIVYTYVYFGGFRAVVTADTVQVIVLIAFAGVLVFLVLTGSPSKVPPQQTRYDLPTIGNLAGAIVFGVCWFFAALDFYSRLNFHGRKKHGRTTSFIFVSCALTLALLLMGTIFGRFLAGQMHVDRATTYARRAVDFFLHKPPLITVVFIAGIFSMIFTTVDTLILMNLQVGYYQERRWFRRETLLNVIVAAILLSTRLSLDATSLSGIFIGSLFVFPSLAIARQFCPRTMAWLPESPRYLLIALAMACLIFLCFAPRFVSRYDRHFYCALLTLGSAVFLGLPLRVWQFLRGKMHG